jgi:hypothetical protein
MSLIEEARTVRDRIASRLRELEPLVREYNELRKLADEMGLEIVAPEPSPEPRPAPRPRRSSGARRGSRAGKADPETPANASGEIAQRVLVAVGAEPGKTVAEYAEILGVAPAALYRPVRELTNDGSLLKRARQLFPG